MHLTDKLPICKVDVIMSRTFTSFIKPNIISFTLFTITKIAENLYQTEVDFAPPLDYQEPETPVVKDVMATKKVEEQAVKDDVKFEPFCGEARRLDGRFQWSWLYQIALPG